MAQPVSGRAVWLQSLSIWCCWVLSGAGRYTGTSAHPVLGTRGKALYSTRLFKVLNLTLLPWSRGRHYDLLDRGEGSQRDQTRFPHLYQEDHNGIPRTMVRDQTRSRGTYIAERGCLQNWCPTLFSNTLLGSAPGPFRAVWSQLATSDKCPQNASRLPGDEWVEAHMSWLQPIVFCFCSWYYTNNISGHCK